MKNLENNRAFKALLLAGGASVFALATPAMAQDESTPAGILGSDIDTDAGQGNTQIVVTGSRIQRQDFEANSPIVTIDEGLLENSATAALEQNLNKLPQFIPAQTPTDGLNTQPTATNTPGAATVSLRGIGANRNLVLVDGRRATPGNASGVVDINTIPAAAIERVEIVTGGASATYGADAIAGVTNFILRKNVNGLELDGRAAITQQGDGFEYQLSGIMGTDFADGRGNISMALSTNVRESYLQTDRQSYIDLLKDPQVAGNLPFMGRPGIVTDPLLGANPVAPGTWSRIFPGSTTAFICQSPNCISVGPFGPTLFTHDNGDPFIHSGFTSNFFQGGFQNFAGFSEEPLKWKLLANGGLGANRTDRLLILPLTRYNGFTRGDFEINDWISVFGQALVNHTETMTREQGSAIAPGWDVYIPYGTGVYTGSQLGLFNSAGADVSAPGNLSSVLINGVNGYIDPTPNDLTDNPTSPAFAAQYADNFSCAASATGGCTNNQLFGQFLPDHTQLALNSRRDPNEPVQIQYGFPPPREVSSEVTTFNLIAGFEGSIPGTDWTWEAFVNHGESSTFTNQVGGYSLTRTRTLLQAPGFGLDFNSNSNEGSVRPDFAANFGTCTTGLNVFQIDYGNVSNDCKDAIRADLRNRSKIRQTIAEVNVQGGLLELPAGDLRFAAGASYREQDFSFLNDAITSQGVSFRDQAIGIYPSADTSGFYDVRELYGELLIPIIADVPFIQELNLEVGGRVSDYSTTGASYTYKIAGEWSVTDWLRFRGGYNRAERAPNIAELFLSPQQTFSFNTIGDICSERSNYYISANPAASDVAADVKAVCRAVIDNTAGPGTSTAYYDARPVAQQPAPGQAVAFPTFIGNPDLTPEKADTFTVGVVLNRPFTSGIMSNLRISVDYFNVSIRDAIGVSPAATLQQCLDPAYNPLVAGAAGNASQALAAATSDSCAGPRTSIEYSPAPSLGASNIVAAYTNDGTIDIAGIDAQIDWSFDLGPGMVTTNVIANYFTKYKVAELSEVPAFDYVGTFGTTVLGLNPGTFEYRILATLGYRFRDRASLALQWQHLPSVEDSGEAAQQTNQVGNPDSYNMFALNGSFAMNDAVNLRFGVENLFDKDPPLVQFDPTADNAAGQLRGGTYNSTFYDTQGRRFYLGANITF